MSEPDGAADRDDGAGLRPDDRRPRSVYGVGSDPDVRFSLANERTALAWVRTALGLVAGGVALTSFAALVDLPTVLDVVAAVACLGGAALAVYALTAWRRNERAMREGRPLPAPTALPVLVAFVVVFAVAFAVYAAVGR